MLILKRISIPIVIIAVYLLTAIYSNGYHHPDEHYQIIEFAGLKGGWNTGADLCWEYDAQIRPALQPMLALTVFKGLGLLGITNPFHLALGLRLLTALFAACCILVFIRSFQSQIAGKYHSLLMLLSFLLWFLPAVNVRFSSETWSGLTLLLSVALLNNMRKQPAFRLYFVTGILWGFSFEFRYQMAIALFGLFVWLIVVKKSHWKQLSMLMLGAVMVVAVCILLDAWFYGNWVFAPWNYFYVNMVEDVASHFGVSPWYFYLERILNAPTPVIGILMLGSMAVLLLFDYKHVLVWCVLPFVLVHSMIAHKELRFLFPIVNFLPLMLILALQHIEKRWNNQSAIRAVIYPIGVIALLINMGGLVMLSSKPASDGNMEILQYIDKRYDHVNLYTTAGSNPYVLGYQIKGLTPRFYANDKVTVKDLATVLRADTQVKLENDDLVMLYACYHESDQLEKEGFQIEKKSIPDWIVWLDQFYKVYDKYRFVFVLYAKPEHQPSI